jgi:hypothetical protein
VSSEAVRSPLPCRCGRGFTGGRCWYKRWWVLSGHTLCYYTKEEAYEKQERPHRVVDLGGARVEDRGMERWNGKVRSVRGCVAPRVRVWLHWQQMQQPL